MSSTDSDWTLEVGAGGDNELGGVDSYLAIYDQGRTLVRRSSMYVLAACWKLIIKGPLRGPIYYELRQIYDLGTAGTSNELSTSQTQEGKNPKGRGLHPAR